jgi:integrase
MNNSKLFKPQYTDREGQKKKAKRWYLGVSGTRKSIALYPDKALSHKAKEHIDQLLAKRQAGQSPDLQLQTWLNAQPEWLLKRLVTLGFLDARLAQGSRGLSDHLQEWKTTLIAKGNVPEHTEQTHRRAKTILQGFQTFANVSASKVQIEISMLQRTVKKRVNGKLVEVSLGNATAKTQNYYLQSCQQFFRWAVKDGRINSNILEHLNKKKAQSKPQTALTAKELSCLLTHTEAAGISYGLTGYERANLYRFAALTGFRSNEIRSFRVTDIDLNQKTVTLSGEFTKNGKEAIIPLHTDLTVALREYLKGKLPSAEAFVMPSKHNVARMFRKDAEAGHKEWIEKNPDDDNTSFLKRDLDEVLFNFHSLRHTFGSLLAASGTHPKTAQTLMRHSTINLTMNLYTHSFRENEVSAINNLPDLSSGNN